MIKKNILYTRNLKQVLNHGLVLKRIQKSRHLTKKLG